jgi:hypothetical protein
MEEETKVWYKAPELESAVLEFEGWRKKVKKKNEPIPLELWELAISLADRYPINKVSRLLGIGSTKLKKLIKKRDGIEEESVPEEESSSFIELAVSQNVLKEGKEKDSQCILELSRADGSHIKIYKPAVEELDINRLCERFVNFREELG